MIERLDIDIFFLYMTLTLYTLCSSACSDSLVEEAAGAKSAVKSFKETDEQGFRESEVIFHMY